MNEHIVADFRFWDEQELLTVTEIGWLWCGLEPPRQGRMYWRSEGPPLRPTDPPLSKAEIITYKILEANKDPADPLKKVEDHPRQIVGHTTFRRADLRDWAKRNGYQPLFLFPELRPENQAGLTLDGALSIMAVLAKIVDSRWTAGANAPNKAIKKVVDAAQLLGVQLTDEMVSKYLKISINKYFSP